MGKAGFTYGGKRCRVVPTAAGEAASDDLALRAWRDMLLSPIDAATTFNMQAQGDKELLARQLWVGDISASMLAVRFANPELVEVLNAQTGNQHDRRASDHAQLVKMRLVDGMLLSAVRAQNMHHVPLVTAALTILSEAKLVNVEFHEGIRAFFRGALATETWAKSILVMARTLRPPPADAPLAGVAIACFDNLSMKINYGSYMLDGAAGTFLTMTNWFSCVPPRLLAPPTFDATQIFCDGIFRKNVSISQFCRLFQLTSPAVATNRTERWTKHMRAIKNGTHLARPRVTPRWAPHKIYNKPMYGRLQSSYDDVRHEMAEMRDVFKHLKILFIAGDGLSLMRMNHLLAAEADVWLNESPCVVPIQGEHPHGLFHGMHCQWRLFRPFIMKCAEVLQNAQIKADPTVSEFNVSRFFLLNILTPAVGEYVLELARDPAAENVDDPGPFMAKASANVNLDWLCHFLHDNAFWVLEFLENVRGNNSIGIDVLWREFFSSAHTSTAHKTQYVGMAIMRVFWGLAMTSDLNAFYHAIRTIPSGTHDGCGVGWDMPIEQLNHAIKSHLGAHVSEAQINNFILNWACVESVEKKLRDFIYAERVDKYWRGRDATADIATLKDWFRDTIGSTWAQATAPDARLKVCTRSARRPWLDVAAVMQRRGNDAPHAYIRRYVTGMTPFFTWCP